MNSARPVKNPPNGANRDDFRRWTINVFLTPMTDAQLKSGLDIDDPWAKGYPRRLAGAVRDAAAKAHIPELGGNAEVTVTWVFPKIPGRGRMMLRSYAAVIAGIAQAGITCDANVVAAYGTGLINPSDPRVVVTVQETEEVPDISMELTI